MAKKKHAPPDAIERLLSGFFDRLGRSWRAVAAGAVLLLVAFVAASLMDRRSHRSGEAAHARLEAALEAPKDRGRALLAVADEFAGSAAAAEALLRAARELREEAITGPEGERKLSLDLAADALRRFLATGPGEDLELLAREQLAFALEDRGRLADSAKLLRETITEYPDSFLRARLNYELGRVEFALGPDHHDDARSHLQLALDASDAARRSDADASWQRAARFLLAGLEGPDRPVTVEVPIPSGEEGADEEEEGEDAAPEEKAEAPGDGPAD